MRVLFVFSLNDVQSALRPIRTPEIMQLGLSYISSLLQSQGHETRLVVLSRVYRKEGEQLLREAIDSMRPEVIAFYAVTSEYRFITEIADWIRRQWPQPKFLIGGPHATLDPASTMEHFDAACIGEGEHPTLEYVTQISQGRQPSGIPNLWIKGESGIERNTSRPFLKDIDTLPLPDREMWDPWIEEDDGAKPSVLLGRGCPFQCTYCSHHVFRTLAKGAYVRFRSPAKIVEEIAQIVDRNPRFGEIYLEQETIGVNQNWAASLCEALRDYNNRRKTPLTFGVNLAVTPNIDYDRLFANLKSANVRYVNVGLESGSERLRKEILKRRYANQDVIDAVLTAKKHGLKVALFNMIGLPTETPQDFQETVRVNRECQPDWNYTSIFYPYPGTELYRLCKEQGLLPDSTSDGTVNIDMERYQATLDLPTFPRREIQHSFEWFNYQVYRGHRPRYRLLASVLRNKLRTNPKLNRLYRHLVLSQSGRKIAMLFNPFGEKIHALK